MRRLLPAIVLILAATGVSAQEFETTVQGDWGTFALGITRSPGTAAEYRVAIMEVEGRVAICGAGVYTNSSQGQAMRQVMRRSALRMDGRNILRDLSFFPIYSRAQSIVGRVARCKVTDTAPSANPEFEIDTPRSIRF